MNPYKEFVKLMLPVEVRESFELVKVEVNTYPSDTKTDELGEMHIYLDEESTPPKGRTDLRGRKPKRLNEAYIPEKLKNGETPTEALTRCRYSLNRPGNYWTEMQKERIGILFERHPDLNTAYSLTHSLRMIFSNSNADVISGIQSLKDWYDKVEEWNNEIFNVIAGTIKARQEEILNYFINRATNAGAESLNSKIKQFRAQLRGVADIKFFLFRLTKLFA